VDWMIVVDSFTVAVVVKLAVVISAWVTVVVW
jgi:hypothetical protein